MSDPRIDAAAILDRLPPDWCGHRKVDIDRELDLVQKLAKAQYEIARLREAERILLESENEAHIRAQEAEARLRRIAEAALRVIEVDSRYARSFVPPQLSESVAALRIALGPHVPAAKPLEKS